MSEKNNKKTDTHKILQNILHNYTNNLTKYDTELLIKEFTEFLKNKYENEDHIPLNIFTSNLSPFESIVKYLHENKNKNHSEIAYLLKRDRQVIWTTYQRAKKKAAANFDETASKYNVSIHKLDLKNLSILEAIIYYLKKESRLKNSEVSELLKKDQRTVWTSFDRALKKKGEKK